MMSRYEREEPIRRPGGDRPREGIYLDAALAVIGEQVGERIDELGRRRRLRLRLGVAALSVLTIASGSVAAIAITAAGRDADAPAAVVHTVAVGVQCVDGVDPQRPAYFATSFRIAEGTSIDAAAVCATARSTLADEGAAIRREAPRDLLVRADAIVEAAAVPREPRSDGTVTDAATVDEASFGRLSAAGGPAMTACRRDGGLLVLATPERTPPLSPDDRAALCAGVRG